MKTQREINRTYISNHPEVWEKWMIGQINWMNDLVNNVMPWEYPSVLGKKGAMECLEVTHLLNKIES